jgi:uncharacterized protein (TIRG00374 family)
VSGEVPASSRWRRFSHAVATKRGWLIQLALFAGLFGLILWRIDLREVGDAFVGVSYLWLIGALGIYVCSRLIHAVEWQITLARVGNPPFLGLFGILLIGTLVNAVVPASAGDVVKIQLVANRYRLPRVGLVAGRGAEAIVNALIMVFFIAASFALPGAAFGSKTLLWVVAIATILLFAAAIGVSRILSNTPPRWRLLGRLPRRVRSEIDLHWPRVHEGFEVIRNMRLLTIAVVLNFVGWALDILILWAYGRVFHLDVPFAAYVSLSVVIALITIFPITFGNVGTYEFALLGALALYSVPAHNALAYSIGTHLFSTLFNIALGLIAMVALRVRPGELFRLRGSSAGG